MLVSPGVGEAVEESGARTKYAVRDEEEDSRPSDTAQPSWWSVRGARMSSSNGTVGG